MPELREEIQNNRNCRRRVYVVNKSSHDFSPAAEFGTVVYLSEGPMNRYATNNMERMFKYTMRHSGEHDFLVPCSLNVMNCIASAIFASKHGRINLLLFKDGRYIVRTHVLKGGEPDAYYEENFDEVEKGSSRGD